MWHESVMLGEVIDLLKCRDGGIYVDVTLGGGGYAKEILKRTAPDGRLIGIDRDEDAIEESGKVLLEFGERVTIIRSSFSEIKDSLKKIDIEKVDGIVADLGVSSHQIDTDKRGFSFMREGALDMRMDSRGTLTAADLINETDEEELADLFYEYGDERLSRRIARAIVNERKGARIETTSRLAEIVKSAYPAGGRKSKIHSATRVFQALRIVVNSELNELKALVENAPDLLKPSGRLVVISYHSLEDRIVKHSFLERSRTGEFKRVTRSPIRPSEEEVNGNRRARSARLRVIERI